MRSAAVKNSSASHAQQWQPMATVHELAPLGQKSDGGYNSFSFGFTDERVRQEEWKEVLETASVALFCFLKKQRFV